MLSSTGQGRGIPVSEVERLAALQVGSPKLSLENVAYVLEHHKTTTVSTMSRALHIRWDTLKHRMDEMGLTAFSTRQIWSKADLAKFRKLAKEGKTLEDLAEEFGRSIDSIRLTGRRYNIDIYQPGRMWTKPDREYLRRSWGYIGLNTICKKLHREPDAIVQQAARMKLGPAYYRSEDILLADFCRATGISRDRVLGTLAPKYGFPLVRRKASKQQEFYYVDFAKILGWMEAHQDLYDGSMIEDGFFVEPDWLRAKRRRDQDDNSYLDYNVRRTYWSEREAATAKFLYGLGKTPQEIATRVDRSPKAIAYKLSTIANERRRGNER